MKLLKVTAVSSLLNESAEEKLKRARPILKVPKDENGHDAEWYEDMGIAVPSELQQSENVETQMIELGDEDFEIYLNYTVIPLENFLFCTDKEFEGSVLYLKEDIQVDISQTAQEIEEQIKELNQNWLQKLITKIKLARNKPANKQENGIQKF